MEAIIFDFDGTLRPASWPALMEAYIKIFEHNGLDHSCFFKNLEEFKKEWSPDWRLNNKRFGIKDSSMFYQFYNPYVSTPFPWLRNILPKLAKKYKLAILTNSSKESVITHLEGYLKYFRVIVSSDEVEKLKPNPEGINLIIKKWGLQKKRSDILLIGDMAEDIIAAKAAGIKSGVVGWGLGDFKELMRLGPDWSFPKPDFLSLLLL